jgi:RNA polymerase sigma factor (sigma-70 family)
LGNSEEFIKTIRQSRKNNIKYQEKLFKQFYTYTMSICLRYAASKEEAEEILNDSFLKVFKSLKKYDESRTFKPWIRRIIINTSIDYNRKKNSHLQIVVDKETALMSDCTDQLDQFNAEDVMAILQRLPDLLRVVFLTSAKI